MRLKAGSYDSAQVLPFLFQFQTGAIKRTCEIREACRVSLFQFQTGAIKSKLLNSYQFTYRRFNSKLVRLKASVFPVFQDDLRRVSIPNWCD